VWVGDVEDQLVNVVAEMLGCVNVSGEKQKAEGARAFCLLLLETQVVMWIARLGLVWQSRPFAGSSRQVPTNTANTDFGDSLMDNTRSRWVAELPPARVVG
jgi:hypothetical protein